MLQDKLIARVSGEDTSIDLENGIFTTLPAVSLGTSAPVGFGPEEHERERRSKYGIHGHREASRRVVDRLD